VVVDEFLGSLPEDLIVKWLKAAIRGKFDSQISESLDLLKSGRAAEAAIVLESVLEVESENIQAKVMLGRAVVFTDPIRAESLCRGLLPESEFYETAQMVIQCAGLFKKKASPGLLLEAPVKARYLDAIESLANQDFNAALEKMIGVMAENRAYDNDGARKACVAIFHCLGEEHEITKRHRHAFGMVLNV
jgi:putative thioredoxin